MMTRRSARRRAPAVLAALAAVALLGAPRAVTPFAARAHAASLAAVEKIVPTRMRGAAMLFGQNNFDPTTEIPRWASYGMNTVRLMITADSYDHNGQQAFLAPAANCAPADGQTAILPVSIASDPTSPYTNALKLIDKTLAVMKQYAMKAILNVGYVYCRGTATSVPIYFTPAGAQLRQHVIDLWSALSLKYRGDPTVVAYDLLNEPDQTFQANSTGSPALQAQYDTYYTDMLPKMVQAIRQNDPYTYLVVEPAPMALPVGYQNVGGFGRDPFITSSPPPISATIQPVADPSNRVIYSFHDYNPATYTVQSQSNAQSSAPMTYPGIAANNDDPARYWDKTTLQQYFQPLRDWQLAHPNADGSLPRVYAGEIGAERWEPGCAQFYDDTLALFEQWGWDYTFHSMANSNEWNTTFTPSDPELGAAYGDVYTDRLGVLLKYWGLNPHTADYGTVRLPYVQGNDQTYATDFSGAVPVNPQHGEGQGVPPGWVQVTPPNNPTSTGLASIYDGVMTSEGPITTETAGATTELIHYLPAAAPSANPSYLQYGRQSYGLTTTLYMQAFLDPGATAGSASHLALRDAANDEIDAYVNQDGTLGYHVKDGSFDQTGSIGAATTNDPNAAAAPWLRPAATGQAGPAFATAPAHSSAAAAVRVDVSPTQGVTIYRDGTTVTMVPHAFTNLTGYKLELRGANSYATDLTTAPQIQIFADDVTISHNLAALLPPPAAANLAVTNADITTTPAAPVQNDLVTISATIHNLGSAARPSVTRFYDGDPAAGGVQIGADVATPALPNGGSATVGVTWNTRKAAGAHTLYVVADATNAVGDANRANNTASLAVTVRKNKVKNGDMEDASATQAGQPDGWTASSAMPVAPSPGGPAGTAVWDSTTSTPGGTHAIELTGNGGNAAAQGAPAWVSDPITVTLGEVNTLALWVKTQGASSAPDARVQYLSAAGAVVGTASALLPTVGGTTPFGQVTTTLTVPADPTITRARLVLAGFAPTDMATSGSVWFDNVQLWQ
jgi:aryl-phospho-beta-D-glucosidase BglC (GH1 family)